MDLEGVGKQHSRDTCTSLRKALQLIVVIIVRLLYKPFSRFSRVRLVL